MSKAGLAGEAKQFALCLKDRSFYGKQENFCLTAGQYIKCLRMITRVRRKELANKLHVSTSTLANWENDLIPLTIDKLDRIYWVLVGWEHA
ncbi:MAG: hypothetical protein CV045_14120 [Cyanobacteria bacterium M5B4]|nr:MAG: hypothetical protein CV045_14120 [Cyanobacteria bacterium M5B4]